MELFRGPYHQMRVLLNRTSSQCWAAFVLSVSGFSSDPSLNAFSKQTWALSSWKIPSTPIAPILGHVYWHLGTST